VKKLSLGKTDMTGTVARRPEGGWRANLVGGSFDATALLDNVTKPGPTRHDDPPLVIDAKFARVLLGPQREARDVIAQLYSDGAHWQASASTLRPSDRGRCVCASARPAARGHSIFRRPILAPRCVCSMSRTR